MLINSIIILSSISLILWLILTFFFLFFVTFIVFLINGSKVIFQAVWNNFVYDVCYDRVCNWKLSFLFGVCQNVRCQNSINFLFWWYPLWLIPFKTYRHSIVQHQFTMESSLGDKIVLFNNQDQFDFVCCNVGLQIHNCLQDGFLLGCEVRSVFRVLDCFIPELFDSIFLFQELFLFLLFIRSKERSGCVKVFFSKDMIALNEFGSLR